MMTEISLKRLLKQLTKEHSEIQDRFEEFDNYDDLQDMTKLEVVISIIKNILEVA